MFAYSLTFIRLLTQVMQSGKTALHIAAQKGRDRVVAVLLDHGADINQVPADNAPSLTEGIAQANEDSWTPLMNAALENKVSTCRLLVERGARLDFVDKVWR